MPSIETFLDEQVVLEDQILFDPTPTRSARQGHFLRKRWTRPSAVLPQTRWQQSQDYNCIGCHKSRINGLRSVIGVIESTEMAETTTRGRGRPGQHDTRPGRAGGPAVVHIERGFDETTMDDIATSSLGSDAGRSSVTTRRRTTSSGASSTRSSSECAAICGLATGAGP